MAKVELQFGELGGGSLSVEYVTGTWYGSSPNYLTIPTTKKANAFVLTVVYSGNSYVYESLNDGNAVLQNGTAWKQSGVDVIAQFNDNDIFIGAAFSVGQNLAYKCYVYY